VFCISFFITSLLLYHDGVVFMKLIFLPLEGVFLLSLPIRWAYFLVLAARPFWDPFFSYPSQADGPPFLK